MSVSDSHFDQRDRNLLRAVLDGVKNLLKPIESRLEKVESKVDKVESKVDKVESKVDKIETNHLNHMEVYMSQLCKKNDLPYTKPEDRNPKPES